MEGSRRMKNFYQLLSMNEGGLKRKIHESADLKGKLFYWFVLAFRAFLIVCFAVLFVSLGSAFFGSENSAMAVVLLVVVLTIRFVHFKYCIGDTLVMLAVVMAIFTFMPTLAVIAPAWAKFFIHFIALFALVCITVQKPEMGLGGLIGFSYVYLVGNVVAGDALIRRAELAIAGYIICAAIMIHQHRNKDKDVRFHHFFKQFKVSSLVNLWQLRFASGLALCLTLGELLHIPRFMWMGFACSTMLARYPYHKEEHKRFLERVEGVVIGSVGFIILCNIIPESTYGLIGLIGGFFLAFCVTYRWKTIVICFGALSMAIGLYGVTGAAVLRILNNILGATFAMVYMDGYDAFIASRLAPELRKIEEEQKEEHRKENAPKNKN